MDDPEKLREIIRKSRRGWMLLIIVEAAKAGPIESEIATWCLSVSDHGILAVWMRAVAVLKLPDDVRELAKWN